LPPLFVYTIVVVEKNGKTPKHSNPLFIEANLFCGISKGISKAEMMVKMKECIPRFFREIVSKKKVRDEQNKNLYLEELSPVPGAGGETEGSQTGR
jgi:hypothetical protein